MNTRAFPLLALLALVACASPAPPERGMRPMPQRGSAEGLELLPRPNWWHETRLNVAIDVSGEQMQQLDALQKEHGEEITRLQNDLRLVNRDLANVLARRDANAADILAAGDRLAQLRDDLFRRQLAWLAAQRVVLTHSQWQALRKQLEERDDERMMEPPGGRGGVGRGGGGRRPPRGQ